MGTINLYKLYKQLYKCTSKDLNNPALTGIYHHDNHLIATDGHCLAKVKYQYNTELEQKIIDKKGNPIERKYPNYQSIIPQIADCKEITNFESCENLLSIAELKSKENKKNYKSKKLPDPFFEEYACYIKIENNVYFDPAVIAPANALYKMHRETPKIYLYQKRILLLVSPHVLYLAMAKFPC